MYKIVFLMELIRDLIDKYLTSGSYTDHLVVLILRGSTSGLLHTLQSQAPAARTSPDVSH